MRAYLLKEAFQFFWGYVSPYWAGQFLDRWCTKTMRSANSPSCCSLIRFSISPRAQ
ncbi:hypothetical protein [Thiolapillus sp.]|uniref:hypothetical protein n=1 Tax=Thiolapillus sp. TaxID=2017437 RepID=UPI003AF49D9D